jgi:hypothetical protein
MEKFQKSTFDWETLNCSPYLDLFARFLKLFKSTGMLTFTIPKNSESFIPFAENRCKPWYVCEEINIRLMATVKLSRILDVVQVKNKKLMEKMVFS